jgi:hypothetical protein
MSLRIIPIQEKPWGDELLHRDPIECLRFLRTYNQLLGTHGAHAYVDPGFDLPKIAAYEG